MALVGAATGAASWIAAALCFWRVSPEVYMDEIFHVPQAQAYCQEKWGHWTPEITTPPGLYVCSYLYNRILSAASFPNPCEAAQLRSLNYFFSLGSLLLMWRILLHRMSSDKASVQAVVLWLYPPAYFFTFLFYTDPGSTFFILLAYCLAQPKPVIPSKKGRVLQSSTIGCAAAGCVAITFRQTNAVWCLFIAAASVLNDLETTSGGPAPFSVTGAVGLVSSACKQAGRLLKEHGLLLLPVVGFMIFLRWNGGIVLGDKEHHVPSVHPAQMAYLFVAAAAVHGTAALKLDAVHQFRLFMFSFLGSALVGAMALMLHKYPCVHEFLLADNRHYTFYIWRRFLGVEGMQLALTPVYAYCGWLVVTRMLQVRSSWWVMMWLVASAVTLVPAPLLEPRYLTVPLLLAHLNSPVRRCSEMAFMALAFSMVNAVTVFVFLFKPFTWGDGSTARFICLWLPGADSNGTENVEDEDVKSGYFPAVCAEGGILHQSQRLVMTTRKWFDPSRSRGAAGGKCSESYGTSTKMFIV
ncbi:unnamed protein product [Chrysoparadoxa australica]